MSILFKNTAGLPPQQQAIRDRCCHPTGTFIEFRIEEIEQSIPERFEDQVRKYPDRLAVKTDSGEVTYRQLNRLANRIAWSVLAHLGAGPEPVALLFEQGIQGIAAMLGVLKSGKFFALIDSSFPQDRIAHILEDSQAALVLTNTQNLALTTNSAGTAAHVLDVDQLGDNLPDGNPSVLIHPDDFAYIIYTSGSTGQAKGVVQSHRNLLFHIMNRTNSMHICAEDRSSLLSWGTAQTIKNIFCSVLTGNAVFPFNVREEGVAGMAAWLNREKITLVHVSAVLYRNFIDTVAGQEKFPYVRLIRLASQTITPSDVESYKKHFGKNCILLNGLSMSETGEILDYFMDQDSVLTGDSVPVGYPGQHSRVLILGDEGQEVGFDQVGEIAVKSRFITPGYWHMDELTKAKFIPDTGGGGERIYFTGDLGIMSPDGCVVHLGRKDSRVKIRGYSVELSEVESKLLSLDPVDEAVVVARDDAAGNKRLVAYVVGIEANAVNTGSLRQALAQVLPTYMVPSTFVILDSIPRLSNGKVNSQSLPVPTDKRPDLNSDFVGPQSELEQQLITVWEELLGVHPIGVKDDFFELGGDSILASQLFVQIDKLVGRGLPVTTLLEAPTIERLADVLYSNQGQTDPGTLVPIQATGSRPPIFFIHSASGHVLFYTHLARHLGTEQPVYGLQTALSEEGEPVFTEVEAMAADYIEHIRAVQPAGPYYLGGLCMAGIIAFEMAQQLRQQGQEVALLALFDSPLPSSNIMTHGLRGARNGVYFARRLLYKTRQRLRRGPQAFLGLFSDLAGEIKGMVVPNPIPQTNRRAGRKYIAKTYAGQIEMFLPMKRTFGFSRSRRLAWRNLSTRGFQIHYVPGYQAEMMREPYVRVLAQQLEKCMYGAIGKPEGNR